MNQLTIIAGLVCATTLSIHDKPLLALSIIILSWFGAGLANSLNKK